MGRLQTDFFLNRPKKGQRRVRGSLRGMISNAGHMQDDGYAAPSSAPRPVFGSADRTVSPRRVGAWPLRRSARYPYGPSAAAAAVSDGARKLKHEVTHLAGQRGFGRSRVGADRVAWCRRREFSRDVRSHGRFVSAGAGDGHQVHDHLEGPLGIFVHDVHASRAALGACEVSAVALGPRIDWAQQQIFLSLFFFLYV